MGNKARCVGKDNGNVFLPSLMVLVTMNSQPVRNRSIYVVVA